MHFWSGFASLQANNFFSLLASNVYYEQVVDCSPPYLWLVLIG
jgi:hypothetical protein